MNGSYYHAFMHHFYKLCCPHKLQELDTEPLNILGNNKLPHLGGDGGDGMFLGG